MIANFEIFPIGVGSSISPLVAEAVKIVDASGLDYKVTAMGTIVEGDFDAVMRVIAECHKKVMQSAERVVTHIILDDRKGYVGRIAGKVQSVEQKVGRQIKK